MSHDKTSFWETVHQAFLDLLDVPQAEHETRLEAMSLSDEAVAEVRSLLSAHSQDAPQMLPGTIVSESMQRPNPQEDLSQLCTTGELIAGRYRVLERIGRGATGAVYRAQDEISDTPVALKVIPHTHDVGAARQEAAILRALRLPGVVSLLDDGEEDGRFAYLVMEFVRGRPFPGRSGQTWADMERTVVALLETLARMHHAGVVHRDLKPGNVLVQSDGRPVVVDLGISRPTNEALGDDPTAFIGTLRYMAPEQVGRGIWSARSDLYAVGVMLHEALTGRAFQSDRTAAWRQIGLSDRTRPPLLSLTTQDVPDAVGALVDQLLAEEPSLRPGSALEALQRLPRYVSPNAAPQLAKDADSAVALRALFHGPERLHRLPSDAADELWERTLGRAGDVQAELEAWERAGLGHWSAGRFRIRRAALERLRSGLRLVRHGTEPPPLQATDEEGTTLLRLIAVAGIDARDDLMAKVLGWSQAELESRLERLTAAGSIERTGDHHHVRVPAEAPGEARRLMHLRIAHALPAGDRSRMRHLIAGGALDRVPQEAIESAARRFDEGDVRGQIAVALDALRVLSARPDPARERELLESLLQGSLRSGLHVDLEEALFRLSRASPHPHVEAMMRLARGALRGLAHEPERALRELPDPRAFDRPRLRTLALSARLFSVRQLPADEQRPWLEDAARLVEASGHAADRFALSSAEAWLAYAEDRYADAARLHSASLTLRESRTGWLTAALNAASAFLEAGDFDQAERMATDSIARSADTRNVIMEARALRLQRAAAYRRGDALVADPELVDAALEVQPYMGALAGLTEAGIAWRTQDWALAKEQALRAADVWRRGRAVHAAALAEALAYAAGGRSQRGLALLQEAADPAYPARIAVQIIGLLASADESLRPRCRVLIEDLAPSIRDDPALCLDVISLDEARTFAQG